MPYTPAQRRLFGAQMRRGDLSKAEFDRRMGEGTRKDVDKSGHAKTSKKRKVKTTTKRARK